MKQEVQERFFWRDKNLASRTTEIYISQLGSKITLLLIGNCSVTVAKTLRYEGMCRGLVRRQIGDDIDQSSL